MAINLYKFGSIMGLPDPSPFCFKLETYLRMAGLEYEVAADRKKKAPTGKRPSIVDEDGKLVADSGLIIEDLEARNGHPLDGKLTLEQRAQGLAFQSLMDEHLYWVLVYSRWLDPDGVGHWTPYMKEVLGVPGPVFALIKPLAQRIVREQLNGHGMGRHDRDTMYKMAITDVRALAHWLGQRKWGFGEASSTFDAGLSAYIGQLVAMPWTNPLVLETRKHRNLVSHFERVMTRYYPELDLPKHD